MTGTWTTTVQLVRSRSVHVATLLPDGRVLVAGGFNDTSGSLASAELYDPASGTWSATGSLAEGRSRPSLTLLLNGLVLVAGGQGDQGTLASSELYDPASGTWSPTGALPIAIWGHRQRFAQRWSFGHRRYKRGRCRERGNLQSK